jgi:hypothetical protein
MGTNNCQATPVISDNGYHFIIKNGVWYPYNHCKPINNCTSCGGPFYYPVFCCAEHLDCHLKKEVYNDKIIDCNYLNHTMEVSCNETNKSNIVDNFLSDNTIIYPKQDNIVDTSTDFVKAMNTDIVTADVATDPDTDIATEKLEQDCENNLSNTSTSVVTCIEKSDSGSNVVSNEKVIDANIGIDNIKKKSKSKQKLVRINKTTTINSISDLIIDNTRINHKSYASIVRSTPSTIINSVKTHSEYPNNTSSIVTIKPITNVDTDTDTDTNANANANANANTNANVNVNASADKDEWLLPTKNIRKKNICNNYIHNPNVNIRDASTEKLPEITHKITNKKIRDKNKTKKKNNKKRYDNTQNDLNISTLIVNYPSDILSDTICYNINNLRKNINIELVLPICDYIFNHNVTDLIIDDICKKFEIFFKTLKTNKICVDNFFIVIDNNSSSVDIDSCNSNSNNIHKQSMVYGRGIHNKIYEKMLVSLKTNIKPSHIFIHVKQNVTLSHIIFNYPAFIIKEIPIIFFVYSNSNFKLANFFFGIDGSDKCNDSIILYKIKKSINNHNISTNKLTDIYHNTINSFNIIYDTLYILSCREEYSDINYVKIYGQTKIKDNVPNVHQSYSIYKQSRIDSIKNYSKVVLNAIDCNKLCNRLELVLSKLENIKILKYIVPIKFNFHFALLKKISDKKIDKVVIQYLSARRCSDINESYIFNNELENIFNLKTNYVEIISNMYELQIEYTKIHSILSCVSPKTINISHIEICDKLGCNKRTKQDLIFNVNHVHVISKNPNLHHERTHANDDNDDNSIPKKFYGVDHLLCKCFYCMPPFYVEI